MQLFAIALVSSIDIIEEEWEKYWKAMRNEGGRSEHESMADEASPTIEDYPTSNVDLSVVDEVENNCNSHSEESREIAGEQDMTGACPDNVGTSPVCGDAETEMELVKPLPRGAEIGDQTKDVDVDNLKNDNDDDGRTARGSLVALSLSATGRESCEGWMIDTSESTSSESDREHRLSTQNESGKSSEAERKEEESFRRSLFEERAAGIPWLFSRMGFLEKVAVDGSNHTNITRGMCCLGDN